MGGQSCQSTLKVTVLLHVACVAGVLYTRHIFSRISLYSLLRHRSFSVDDYLMVFSGPLRFLFVA